MQSICLLHHLSALIHACEVLHLLSPEYGHGLEPKVNIIATETSSYVHTYIATGCMNAPLLMDTYLCV